MGTAQYEGRSGQVWEVRSFRRRPGYLRPNGVEPHTVEMVRSRDDETYGALRRFRSRAERRVALSFLTEGSPITPVTLDVVDDARLPPALITSWAPGSTDRPLEKYQQYDDLGHLLDEGHRFTPAQALRTVVALGQALDAVAELGCTPIEISPDHLIYNRGSVRLVGIARHLYRPDDRDLPDPGGMSLPSTLLIGDDYPGRVAGGAVWRRAQVRALLRLVGWMTCGLAPSAWGRVSDDRDLWDYLVGYAGYPDLPELRPGDLAGGLARAAEQAEEADGRRRLTSAEAVVIYDARACLGRPPDRREWVASLRGQVLSATVEDVKELVLFARIDTDGDEPWLTRIGYENTGIALEEGARINLRNDFSPGQRVCVHIDSVGRSSSGWPPIGATLVDGPGRVAFGPRPAPPIAVNPESVRLGLMVEHGRDVVAIAAIRPEDWTKPQATTLSGAGWLLFPPAQLSTVVRRLGRHLRDARFVIAGRSPAAAAELAGHRVDHVDPDSARPPTIAGRPATELPYIRDVELNEFAKDMSEPGMTRVARRRRFAAGWALAWEPPAAAGRAGDPRGLLRFLAEQFGNDTELLLRVRLLLNRPVFQHDNASQIRANVRRAAPILSGMPPGGLLREHLMIALLSRSREDVGDAAKKRLLPVAPRLAQAYDPAVVLAGRPMDEAIRDPAGIERLGLFGRLVTAMPEQDPEFLAAVVSALEDPLVRALHDIPAPSLQHLAGRIASSEFRELLNRFAGDDDLDLLDRYTPAAWEALLTGTRAPEQIGHLGLGWSLIVDRDPWQVVDPRAVLDLATAAGREPRHVVRLLLDVPEAVWPLVHTHRLLAAAWLREFDALDIAGVLDRYPDADELVRRFGARTVRAGQLAGLAGDQLPAVSRLAEAVGLEREEVITACLRFAPEPELTDLLTGAAGTAWIRSKMDQGATFGQCVQRLADRPDDLRAWAVDGPRLPRRVLSDLLGDDVRDLGVPGAQQQAFFDTLTRNPGLTALIGRVIFPRQRLALLRLLHEHPHLHRWPRLLDPQVTALLADEDPRSCLDLVLADGLTPRQAMASRRLRLSADDRVVLRGLGPIADELTDEHLSALLRLGRLHGVPCAVTAALTARTRPETLALVHSWGPDWLPLLAGPHGDFVAAALRSVDEAVVRPHKVSSWLRAAGADGLRTLDRHGERLLRIVAENRPPVNDVRLLDHLLSRPGWPVDRLYPLIVRHGLPAPTWDTAARRLLEGRAENDILAEIWCCPAI